MGTWDQGRLALYKDVGRVEDVFDDEVVATLSGKAGVAHVRYPTVGSSSRNDAQPFTMRRPSIVLAHNGNLVNLPELEQALAARGLQPQSRCDAEPILLVLGDELLQIRTVGHTTDDLALALRRTMEKLRGGYAVVAVMEVDGKESLVAFRDPHGIRPAVYGRRDGAWAIASESVSLDVLDFERVGDVPGGSVIVLRRGEEPVIREVLKRETRHCIFEDIYFARPDSVMAGARVYNTRWELGKRLADEVNRKGIVADVVVPVPDTSRPAAHAMAERLGIPHREGFIKNRYSGRTFIMPDQRTREAAMRVKLNPIEEMFRNQRVLIVDDSIVRGTTMRRIVRMVRRLEPKEIHVAIFSPAVRNPCFYGIDMPSREELVAWRVDQDRSGGLEERLADQFGADSVTFLSEEGLVAVAGSSICAACFTGRYPVEVRDDEQLNILRDRRPDLGPDPHTAPPAPSR